MPYPAAFVPPHWQVLHIDEAQAYADVIFVGEAESQWPQFLKDFEAGQYAPRYSPSDLPTLDDAPPARKELYHRRDHTAGRLFATRGYPVRQLRSGGPCR